MKKSSINNSASDSAITAISNSDCPAGSLSDFFKTHAKAYVNLLRFQEDTKENTHFRHKRALETQQQWEENYTFKTTLRKKPRNKQFDLIGDLEKKHFLSAGQAEVARDISRRYNNNIYKVAFLQSDVGTGKTRIGLVALLNYLINSHYTHFEELKPIMMIEPDDIIDSMTIEIPQIITALRSSSEYFANTNLDFAVFKDTFLHFMPRIC